MRMALPLVLACAGACGRSRPEPSTPTMTSEPVRTPATPRCELTPEAVRCTVYNPGGDYSIECVEPYLAIRASGDLLSGERRWCSPPIAPGGLATFDAIVGVRPTEVCGPELDGCVLRMFHDGAPSDAVARIAAFAREIEATATRPGKQPTMKECDDARLAWLATPALAERYKSLQLDQADVIGLFCKLHISREQLQCFAAARTEAEVEACAPESAH